MRLGSITLALINPKACSTTYIRKREKRAFLTFFEKTLTSSYQIRLSHFHAHTHTKIFDRSIDSSKPKNTRLHRESENPSRRRTFSSKAFSTMPPSKTDKILVSVILFMRAFQILSNSFFSTRTVHHF